MSTDEVDPIAQLAEAAARLEDAERRYRAYGEAHALLDEQREQLRTEVGLTRDAVRMLCEVLIKRGQLVDGHLRLVERLLRSTPAPGRPRLRMVDDKHSITGPAIDCASRFHLCQGRCCTLDVDLAREDLEDGVKWEIDEPYKLRHDEDRWCHHVDRATGGCTIYERRPAVCRQYDCRADRRVWIDFDARLPAPLPERLRAGVPAFARPADEEP
jgi:Fe-S-cluster containining protein